MKKQNLSDMFKDAAFEHGKLCCVGEAPVVGQLALLFLYWTRISALAATFGELSSLEKSEAFNLIAVASDVVADEQPVWLENVEPWLLYRRSLGLIVDCDKLSAEMCGLQMQRLESAKKIIESRVGDVG